MEPLHFDAAPAPASTVKRLVKDTALAPKICSVKCVLSL